ncbi:hypothetical protein C8R45DRAFT_1183407 [Mycena sanguinolenta]|nr:hypothetical protein C8R45DRAFT_1183407 [Mycena sanguinolenta]
MLSAFENVLPPCALLQRHDYEDDRCSHARKTVDLLLAPAIRTGKTTLANAGTNATIRIRDHVELHPHVDVHLYVPPRPSVLLHRHQRLDSTLRAHTAHPNGTAPYTRAAHPRFATYALARHLARPRLPQPYTLAGESKIIYPVCLCVDRPPPGRRFHPRTRHGDLCVPYTPSSPTPTPPRPAWKRHHTFLMIRRRTHHYPQRNRDDPHRAEKEEGAIYAVICAVTMSHGGGDEYTASPPSPSTYASTSVSTSPSPAFTSYASPRLVRSPSFFRVDSLLQQHRKRPAPHLLHGDARSAPPFDVCFCLRRARCAPGARARGTPSIEKRAVAQYLCVATTIGSAALTAYNGEKLARVIYAGADEKERTHAHMGNFAFPRRRCCAGFGFCAMRGEKRMRAWRPFEDARGTSALRRPLNEKEVEVEALYPDGLQTEDLCGTALSTWTTSSSSASASYPCRGFATPASPARSEPALHAAQRRPTPRPLRTSLPLPATVSEAIDADVDSRLFPSLPGRRSLSVHPALRSARASLTPRCLGIEDAYPVAVLSSLCSEYRTLDGGGSVL